MIAFTVPVKTENPSNGSFGTTRGAAMAQARARSKQRGAGRLCTLAAVGHPRPLWRVTLVRVSAGKLDSHDNLRSALKHVADGIADALGVDDGGGLVEWVYGQRPGEPKKPMVEVTVESIGRTAT